MESLIKTNPLSADLIKELLAQERKKEDTARQADAFYRHNFDKKMVYLFDLHFEHMFVPWKSSVHREENPYWHCLGCAGMIKDRESHFNWHKRELHDTTVRTAT